MIVAICVSLFVRFVFKSFKSKETFNGYSKTLKKHLLSFRFHKIRILILVHNSKSKTLIKILCFIGF